MNHIRLCTLTAALSTCAGIALAQGFDETRYSSAGHEYALDCNENGYVLTSKYPVARMVGNTGVEMHFESGIQSIFLGKSCDASSYGLGTGSWGWANGGFIIELQDARFGFPRQELACPTPRPFEGSCPSQ